MTGGGFCGEVHPYALRVPPLAPEDYEALREDIRANGLKRPLMRDAKGRLIDGCHRLKACDELKIEPIFDTLETEDDREIWTFIVSNTRHRHLNAGQKAGWAHTIRDVYDDIAKAEKKKTLECAARDDTGKFATRPGKDLPGRAVPKSGTHTTAGQRAAADDLLGTTAADPLPKRDYAAEDARKAAAMAAAATGANRQYVQDFKTLDEHDKAAGTDFAAKVMAGDMTIPQAKREIKKAEVRAKLADEAEIATKAAQGVYDVIVIDPPWPMKKIERDVRPNQAEFDYTTMTETELEALDLPCADDAHVWVWTTHKFLPMALRLLGAWRLKYVCTFVWHKPGGFQPHGLPQFNCEFALYARRGNPQFLDTKAFPTAFQAPRAAHSEKPEAFYDVVRRVTGGRRLDMFNRRAIEGFDGWGKQCATGE